MAVVNRTAQENTLQTPEAALQDLVRLVLERKTGNSKPTTFAALCDAVDCGPSRVHDAITALRASGYTVRLTGMRAFAR